MASQVHSSPPAIQVTVRVDLTSRRGKYSRHFELGMARTFTCSRGIAALMRGESWESTKLPECFQPTPERLAKTETVEQLWCEADKTGVPLMH